MSDNLADPLLVLLRRHEEANSAFDSAADRDASQAEREHLFVVCGRTMQAIIDRAPTATTAAGAVAALDHILNDAALWHRSAGDDFLRHLIQACARLHHPHCRKMSGGNRIVDTMQTRPEFGSVPDQR
jgi:hypothetical protein